jgi:hypothetical protein
VTPLTHAQRPEGAESTAPPSPGRGGAPADRLRALQTTAGNAAVAQLLRRTVEPPAPRGGDGVVLNVTPLRPMSGGEFAVFVAARLQDISEQEAATRGDELGGSDPHYAAGVSAAEVGKPILVQVSLPQLTASEEADAVARESQRAALPAGERQAIDEMADWNFRRKVGNPVQPRPTQGAAAELWKRTRDEYLRDRNRLDSLPSEIRAIVMPGGRRPDGEYLEALQLAGTLGEFSWEDWALFERRVDSPNGDLRATKKAVNAFTRERASERATLERVRGTEALFDQMVRFEAARNELGLRPERYDRFPGYRPMLAALAARGFRGLWDYQNALADYYRLFQRRGNEIALQALVASERVVQEEIVRYGDASELAALFGALAPLRDMLDTTPGAGAGSRAPTPVDEAEAERGRLAIRYPSLADPELGLEQLGATTPEALGATLRANDTARLKNIHDIRDLIIAKPGMVLQLDRVRELTCQELRADDGTVGHRVVQQHLDEVANRERLTAQAQALLAIGLAALTFGSGTLVVLGTAGELALGAYQANDEWERYQAAEAAAHSALDPEDTLSSQDPSAVWLTLALIGVGLSGAGLVKALRPAKGAIEVLERTGDPAKFRAALEHVDSLTEPVRKSLQRAGDAYAEFKADWWKLAGASTGAAGMGANTVAALKAFKLLARHSARMGIRKLETLLEALKGRRELAKLLGDFTAAEQKQLNAAFAEGIREYDATRPVIKVKFSKGERTVTWREEMLLDGKPITKRERRDVLERLGFKHADDRHGMYKDPVVLADQALDRAASGEDGMMGQWASDEAMLGTVDPARAELNAGRWVLANNGNRVVKISARADVGRIFVANSLRPKIAGVRNWAPVAGKAVTEIFPNKVLAAFEPRNGGWEIASIYPIFEP